MGFSFPFCDCYVRVIHLSSPASADSTSSGTGCKVQLDCYINNRASKTRRDRVRQIAEFASQNVIKILEELGQSV